MNKRWWVACVYSGFARNSQQGLTFIKILLALGILAIQNTLKQPVLISYKKQTICLPFLIDTGVNKTIL